MISVPHTSSTRVNDRLVELLDRHFDPQWGAPFWLARSAELGFDPRTEIRSIDDLPRLGFMNQTLLAETSFHELWPRSLRPDKRELVVAQTGGTTDRPVWTAYTRAEFYESFVDPFVAAARFVGFPEGGSWLYVGPSGPHIIGKAAVHLARGLGSHAPFTIDFDARWFRKTSAGSFAAHRYLAHVVDQAMDVIRAWNISVLFSTPPVLKLLGENMSIEQRRRIRGVHYGGLPLSCAALTEFQGRVYPEAVHLSGYGNTLFGCALQIDTGPQRPIRYFPHGDRLLFGTIQRSYSGRASADYQVTGESGQLVFSRLDASCLLLNVLDRDWVTLSPVPATAPDGFLAPGVIEPRPREVGKREMTAIY